MKKLRPGVNPQAGLYLKRKLMVARKIGQTQEATGVITIMQTCDFKEDNSIVTKVRVLRRVVLPTTCQGVST